LTGAVTPVLVGDKLFHIHTAVLVSSSAFLGNAMKREWRANRGDKPVDLSSECPEVFGYYTQWLYTKAIVMNPSILAMTASVLLAQLYVLGERLVDSLFQDAIIDTFIARAVNLNLKRSLLATSILYEGTGVESPARRLVVDIWAFCAVPEWLDSKSLRSETCTEFVGDLVHALIKKRPRPDVADVDRPWSIQPLQYHCGEDAEKGKEGDAEAPEEQSRKRLRSSAS
jgi:hypothetical protein